MISVFPAPQRRHDGVYQIDKATNEHTGDSNFISLLLGVQKLYTVGLAIYTFLVETFFSHNQFRCKRMNVVFSDLELHPFMYLSFHLN